MSRFKQVSKTSKYTGFYKRNPVSLPMAGETKVSPDRRKYEIKEDMEEKQIDVSFDDMPELLTATELASLFRVAKLTVKRWVKKGDIEAIRINSRGDMRFKREDVLKMYNKGFGDEM